MFWDNDLWIMVVWVDLWRRANILEGGGAKFYFPRIQLELHPNIITLGSYCGSILDCSFFSF